MAKKRCKFGKTKTTGKCRKTRKRERMSDEEWEKMRTKIDKEAGEWDRKRKELIAKGLIKKE